MDCHSLKFAQAVEPFFCAELPVTDYRNALALQRSIVAAKKAQRMTADVVLLLEHFPVFTLGRNGGRQNLMASGAFLKQAGIEVVPVERGGDITYHGPGQLVVYPILNLNAARLSITDYVAGLERVMARVAAEWGIQASGCLQKRGVWCGAKKLGSLGIAIRRGICFHGLALNVNVALEPFGWINPCGLKDVRMTSMQAECGRALCMQTVRESVKRHLTGFLSRPMLALAPASLRGML